jgi:mevalonate kinase
MMKGSYPSKVMLAGEYAVVIGGSALTVPFHRFSARVRSVKDIPPGKEREAGQSIEYLKNLFDYIRRLPAYGFHTPPDLDLFSGNLDSYWLDLDIPVGFGLGSSGAVSAAVYDQFFPGSQELTLPQQKEDLALIESYFHGKSSGVDALTCHAGSTLRFYPSGSVQKVRFDPAEIPGGYRFFLLNSGERADTGPLVKHFLDRMKDKEFRCAMEEEYLPLVEKLIDTLTGEREADPSMLMNVISSFQLEYFQKMIPDKMIDLWLEGQVSNEYYLKLNGSGGGYFLGITHRTYMERLDERWGADLLWIGS